MAADYPVVLELLKANMSPKNLKACFEFLAARGNVPGDVPFLVEFGKSCQDQQTQKAFLDQLKSNVNTQQVMTELRKEGIKGGDVFGCITALKLRGGNPQDLFKKEDVALACSYVKAGCSGADIHQMFELLTGQHKTKELQNFYNAN
jgi:hypothetical protein